MTSRPSAAGYASNGAFARHLVRSLATRSLTAAAVILALSSARHGESSERESAPNVILILTDDQGYGDFSCHGNPVMQTPHLDQLAAQSVRFTDFHVAPMCTPTRGQLMTGRDAVRNGATSVTAGRSFLRPGIYCDNAGHIRQAEGGPQGGPWNVFVERAGEYEIAVRRWPRETDLALADAAGPDSVALPIAAAVVEIAGQRLTAKAAPGAKEIALRAPLPSGRTTLHAWFQDAAGQDLCGAFYSYVRRVR